MNSTYPSALTESRNPLPIEESVRPKDNITLSCERTISHIEMENELPKEMLKPDRISILFPKSRTGPSTDSSNFTSTKQLDKMNQILTAIRYQQT